MGEEQAPASAPRTSRRYIGRRFLALRKQAGLTRAQVAAHWPDGISSTTLGRIENGDHGVHFKQHEVRRILELYHADPTEIAALLGLTAETHNTDKGEAWYDELETSIPKWFSLRVVLEAESDTIRVYQPEIVPGLLQTEAYARALILLATGGDHDETEGLVRVRMDRQGMLTKARPPRLEVILNEAVLHRITATPDIAHDQLHRLLNAMDLSNIVLRLLPYSAGIHGGMTAGAGFSSLSFPVDPDTGEPREPPFVYVDSLTGSMLFDTQAEVRKYDVAWEDMATKAQTTQATRLTIATLLKGHHP